MHGISEDIKIDREVKTVKILGHKNSTRMNVCGFATD
jgi:hypothetical protein